MPEVDVDLFNQGEWAEIENQAMQEEQLKLATMFAMEMSYVGA